MLLTENALLEVIMAQREMAVEIVTISLWQFHDTGPEATISPNRPAKTMAITLSRIWLRLLPRISYISTWDYTAMVCIATVNDRTSRTSHRYVLLLLSVHSVGRPCILLNSSSQVLKGILAEDMVWEHCCNLASSGNLHQGIVIMLFSLDMDSKLLEIYLCS